MAPRGIATITQQTNLQEKIKFDKTKTRCPELKAWTYEEMLIFAAQVTLMEVHMQIKQ